MFERNRVDNSQVQTGIPAEITLDDGSIVAGKFMIAVSTRMQDVLNGPTQYLDFETYDGQRALLAKSSLKSVRIEPVPSAA